MVLVSIYKEIRSRYPERDYTLGKRAVLIDTEVLATLDQSECMILIHANDIKGDSKLINQILHRGEKLNWQIFLFTNNTSKGEDIEDFPNPVAYPWKDIEDNFPEMPPPDKKFKGHLIALFILCQGYVIAHGGTGLRNPAWWQQHYASIDNKLKAETEAGRANYQLKCKAYTETPAWWQRLIDSEQLLCEINDIQGDGTGEWKEVILNLVNYLRVNKKNETYSEIELTHLVRKAYKAYHTFEDSSGRGYL